MLDLLLMIFPDSKVTEGIKMGGTKLPYVINYGLKKYFFEKCTRVVKNPDHFTVCFDKLPSHISNRNKFVMVRLLAAWREHKLDHCLCGMMLKLVFRN